MRRLLLPILPALLTILGSCTDQGDPAAPGSDTPISFGSGKPRGGGFDNANNVGSINGTQWGPSPWNFTSDIGVNEPPCTDQGFCAVGNLINPDFVSAAFTLGAPSNPDPNPAEGCIDTQGNDSVKCYALLSTTNYFEDISDDNVDNPVEIKTRRSGLQTTQATFVEFPNTVLATNTGWQLNFDYAVLSKTPPAGPSTDAFAAVYLDYDSDGNTTLDQTITVLQVSRSDLEQGRVPLKTGGCGTLTLGVPSDYPLCTGWQFHTFDASVLGGKLFRIRLIVDEGGIDPGVATSFAIDNLKFEETVLVGAVNLQPNPAPANSTVNLSSSFTDTEVIPHAATINWGDGSSTPGTLVEPAGATPGSVSGSHSYATPGVYSGLVSVSDGSGAPGQAKFTVTVTAAAALIDIRPGVSVNTIHLKLNLPIPVLLLGGPGFNVRSVPVNSLRFGPAGARAILGIGAVADFNRDGSPDLLTSYFTRQTGIQPGATQACLTGTKSGVAFQGCDAIVTVGTP